MTAQAQDRRSAHPRPSPRRRGRPRWPRRPPARRHAVLQRAISDGGAFVTAGDPRLADLALQRGARAGAQVARLPLLWARVEAGRAPADPTDPADPAYDFARAPTRSCARRSGTGCEPLLRIERRARAPTRRASAGATRRTAPGRRTPRPTGASRPPRRGATPAASRTRCSRARSCRACGSGRRGTSRTCRSFLQPQWVAVDGAWAAFSPSHYRRMLNAFYAAREGACDRTQRRRHRGHRAQRRPARRRGPDDARCASGSALLCLGRAVRATPPRFDVLVHHPLTVTNPDVPARDAGNVSGRRPLQAQAPAARGRPRDARIWVTEINWDSGTRGATAEQLQRWVPRALYRLWSRRRRPRRVAVRARPAEPARASRRALRDRPRARRSTPTRDRPKRAAIRAFRFPFTGTRRDRAHVALWGAGAARASRTPRGRAAPPRRAVGDACATSPPTATAWSARRSRCADAPACASPPSGEARAERGSAYGFVVLSVNVNVFA